MQVIAYTTETGGVAVIYPADSIDAAMKDVPTGVDHAVLDAANLPTGDRDAWSLQNGRIVIDPARKEAAKAAARAGMVCSRFQARAALMQAGMLEQAEAVISQADALTRLAWAEAVEYRRTSPAINAMGAALGLTDDQLDDLYAVAMAIEA